MSFRNLEKVMVSDGSLYVPQVKETEKLAELMKYFYLSSSESGCKRPHWNDCSEMTSTLIWWIESVNGLRKLRDDRKRIKSNWTVNLEDLSLYCRQIIWCFNIFVINDNIPRELAFEKRGQIALINMKNNHHSAEANHAICTFDFSGNG